MLKFEWPLIVPDDPAVKQLAAATFDISEYVVDIARRKGWRPGMTPLDGGVTVHLACHARAQNMGQKAAEMLRLLPDTEVDVIERCSGHGGSWGVMKENFETAIKVGKPVARQAAKKGRGSSPPNARSPACTSCREWRSKPSDGEPSAVATPAAPDRTVRPRLWHRGTWSDPDARSR